MRAQVGDHIVVASPTTGGAVRDGEILEIRGGDGGPPYLVQWSDGSSGLYFPGSDAHLTHGESAPATVRATPAENAEPGRTWRVEIEVVESGDDTRAHAVLVAAAPKRLDATGKAHRNPADAVIPQIGDEVAVARALRRLADRLFELASSDISQSVGHSASLSR